MQTELIPLDQIVINERVRGVAAITDDELEALCESLTRFGGEPTGLLQPILLDQHNVLQDGFRRYNAAKKLGWTSIPVHRRDRLTEAEYFEVELEANFRRKDFTWQETVQAVAKVHKQRLRTAVMTDTPWTQAMTGELLGGYSAAYVNNCLQLHPVINTPSYDRCESITDAVRILLRGKEDRAVAEEARRLKASPLKSYTPETTDKQCIACSGTGKNTKGDLCSPCQGTGKLLKFAASQPVPTSPDLLDLMGAEPTEEVEEVVNLSNMIYLGDSIRTVLPSWPDACVDHVICDPPFGIDVAMLQQAGQALIDVERIRATHTVDENLEMFRLMMPAVYRILKPTGFFVFWIDQMNHQFLHDLAEAAGFKVQRWTHVWCKTSTCKNQSAHYNETKATEHAMFCRKGDATLPSPVLKNFTLAPGLDEKLSNPFAKPFEVWQPLIDAVSIKGQIILDPFAGEGTCSEACLKLGRRVVAVEKDEVHYNYMLGRMRDYWKSVFRKVRFV